MTEQEPGSVSALLSVDQAVAAIRERCTSPVETVLIDGPSGAGKSTLADALVSAWPGAVNIVRMDNIYPGWEGLAAASAHVHESLLEPRHRGATARWRRHDWETGRSAEWHTVRGERSMILEGCGALSRRSAPLSTLRIWLDADDGIRKDRALARDHGGFDDHWDDWQCQFDQFVAAEHPRALADLRIRLP